MARLKRGREIDGLLILDKAPGITSNRCLQQVKHLLDAAKAGHTGALDPLATGVLPLCFGEATKISQFLLDADKVYHTRIKLGISTSTGDSEGEVTGTAPVPAYTLAAIEQVLAGFTGRITQSPSIYSALKQQGVPLYKLARAGKAITPKFRTVTVYQLKLLEWHASGPDELELEVHCSKGTYIRTLAEDIGKALGTGAHVTMLRRTRAGPFTLADCLTMETAQQLAQKSELEEKLITLDVAIAHLPALVLPEEQALLLRQGQAVHGVAGVEDLTVDTPLRTYSANKFIGIAALREDGALIARRLLSTAKLA